MNLFAPRAASWSSPRPRVEPRAEGPPAASAGAPCRRGVSTFRFAGPARALRRAFGWAAVGLLSLTAAPRAFASQSYPGIINGKYNPDPAVSCPLCHQGATDRTTAVQPFVLMLKGDYGLTLGNPDLLSQALDQAEADETDVDGDGVGDIEELRSGTDPNVSGGSAAPTPEYGCVKSSVATAPPNASAYVPLALGAALLGARRARRKR
ncbi:MAG TPA: hypothetical protein VFS00_33185 [Polyangiaceae bacterium]|nr:hypothetical protein [Polyangiaceae bacterium]